MFKDELKDLLKKYEVTKEFMEIPDDNFLKIIQGIFDDASDAGICSCPEEEKCRKWSDDLYKFADFCSFMRRYLNNKKV